MNPGERARAPFMTPEEALAEFGRLERVHGAVARRTAGVTWLVWALAVAATFMTYNYLGVLVSAYAPDAAPLFAIAWIPWIALATVTTRLLWRSTGLVMPVDLRAVTAADGWTGLLILATLAAAFALWWLSGATLVEPAVALAAVGVATAAAAALGLNAQDPFERRAAAACGLTLLAIATAGSMALAGDRDLAYAWFSLLAPAAAALGYGTVGLLVASRG